MQAFLFGITCLAVWRITHLLAKEDGPWDMIFKLRKQVGQGFWGSLLDCFYCLSIWVALPFAWGEGSTVKEKLLWWLALSGAACLLEKVTNRFEEET